MYRLNSIIRKSNTPQKLFIRSLTDAAGNELKLPVSFEDVSRAYHRIRDGVKRTVSLFVYASLFLSTLYSLFLHVISTATRVSFYPSSATQQSSSRKSSHNSLAVSKNVVDVIVSCNYHLITRRVVL